MFLYHMGDEDWQTCHAELKAGTQHHHNLSGVHVRADQKGIRAFGGHFYTSETK